MKKSLELLAHICLIVILSSIAFGGATKTKAAECRDSPCGGFRCTPYSFSSGGCGADNCTTCNKCCRTREGSCQQIVCTVRVCDQVYCETRLGY